MLDNAFNANPEFQRLVQRTAVNLAVRSELRLHALIYFGFVGTTCCTSPCTGLAAMDLAVLDDRRVYCTASGHCVGREVPAVISIY